MDLFVHVGTSSYFCSRLRDLDRVCMYIYIRDRILKYVKYFVNMS